MRGYSLHDLYAKMLALLGLGMLAGTGALMDYWPSEGGNLPMPELASVSVSAPAIVQAAGVVTAAPGAQAPVRSRRAFVRPASLVEVSLGLPASAPVALPPSGSLGAPVPLPVLESASMPGPVESAPVVSEPVALADAAEVPTATAIYTLVEHKGAPVARAIDESNSGGLLSGALRKTGSSLRKTGAKTGSSIVGAIRGFGGAFSGAVRRALPVI